MKNKGWKRQGSVPGAVLFWIRFCLALIWAGSCAISGAAAAYGAESLPDRTEETPTAETLTLEGPVFTDAGQAQELKEILERDGKQYAIISSFSSKLTLRFCRHATRIAARNAIMIGTL